MPFGECTDGVIRRIFNIARVLHHCSQALNETKLSEAKVNVAKEKIRGLFEKLPEDCAVEDVQYHPYVFGKIQRGIFPSLNGRPMAMFRFALNCISQAKIIIPSKKPGTTCVGHHFNGRLRARLSDISAQLRESG